MSLVRRITLLLLAALLTAVFPRLSAPASAQAGTVLRGDANEDGELDALDYILIKKHVLTGTPMSERGMYAADVNDDGEIDAADYFRLRKVMMGTSFFAETTKPLPDEHYRTAVSPGKPYTVSVKPADNYPDTNGIELTDAILAPRPGRSYTDERTVGYPVSSRPLKITVDLESVVSGVFAFEVSYLAIKEAGIGPITGADVELSEDGKKWTKAGTCEIPAFADHMQTATLTLDEPVPARYVRFTVGASTYWIFLDEVTVYADVPQTDSDNRMAEKLNALYASDRTGPASGTAADRSKNRVNRALGRSYTCTASPDERYPDPDGTKLTDPDYESRYGGASWVGFSAETGFSVTLDLGSVYSDLAAFEVLSCANRPTGSYYPLRVRFAVSTDGKNWTEAGRCYAPVTETPVFRFTVESPNALTGRYVRMTADAAGEGVHLIDCFFVYAYTDEPGEAGNDPYGRMILPTVTEDLLWPVNGENKKEINLLSGLPVHICIPGFESCSAPADNTPTGTSVLTDGKLAPNYNIHTDPYVKCKGDAFRLFCFDLGKLVSLSRFELSFAYYPDWAIMLPDKVAVYLSRDGKEWYKAGAVHPEQTGSGFHVTPALKLDSPVSARFVCFRMDISAWVALDEIRAYGTRALTSQTKTPAACGYPAEDIHGTAATTGWAAPSPDLLGGAGDIFLAYHGRTDVRTEEDLLYQVGYYDKDGKLADTMFDGILFLMAGDFPSRLGGGTGGVLNYNKSDLEWLADTLFAEGQNVDALEHAVGTLKKTLSLPDDYRVCYYLSLYLPSCDDFGDLDGDGKSEDLSANGGKLLVLKKAVDMLEAQMQKRNYQNVSFGGYYWYNESMSSDRSDVSLLNAVADYVHTKGRQLFWIPYYTAYGWSSWKTYGLDSACLQPNYAFSLNVPDSRLTSAAVNAARYGMSIEMEMDARCLTDDRFVDRYFAYLEHGARLGFMDGCVHIYYMSSGSLSRFANSESPLQRLLYDNTYHYIRKDLVTAPDAPKPVAVKTQKNRPASGRMSADADPTERYRLYESPKHGTVSLSENGSFTYYPDAGYTGKDSFSVTLSRHMAESAPAAVTVTVS